MLMMFTKWNFLLDACISNAIAQWSRGMTTSGRLAGGWVGGEGTAGREQPILCECNRQSINLRVYAGLYRRVAIDTVKQHQHMSVSCTTKLLRMPLTFREPICCNSFYIIVFFFSLFLLLIQLFYAKCWYLLCGKIQKRL